MKLKILVPVLLIIGVFFSAFYYRNELILYWHTDPEFHARFEKVKLGQTQSEIEALLGKPVHSLRFEDSSDFVLGWPRYEHITYAVLFRNDRAEIISDRFGSF